jgi:hypothetical protein
VPCQWRKRPAVLWGLLWTGANADSIRRFAVSPEGTECTRYQGEGTGLEVWNDQERCWIPCPVGHVVMKGVLGEFYPVSEAGIKGGYDPASRPGTPGQAAREAFPRDACECGHRPDEHILGNARRSGILTHCLHPGCGCGLFAAAAPQSAPEPQAGEITYLYHWRFELGEEFGLYQHAADAHAKAAEHAGDGLSEVLSMAILGRPEPQPAPEGKRVTLKLSETQPAPELAKVLDEFTRTVINVSGRPALTAMARDIRKNHGMEAL